MRETGTLAPQQFLSLSPFITSWLHWNMIFWLDTIRNFLKTITVMCSITVSISLTHPPPLPTVQYIVNCRRWCSGDLSILQSLSCVTGHQPLTWYCNKTAHCWAVCIYMELSQFIWSILPPLPFHQCTWASLELPRVAIWCNLTYTRNRFTACRMIMWLMSRLGCFWSTTASGYALNWYSPP